MAYMTLWRPHQVGFGVVGRETIQLHPQDVLYHDAGNGEGQGRDQ